MAQQDAASQRQTIGEFFAVTRTSIYRASSNQGEKGVPLLEKVALRGESQIPVGGLLTGGKLVGITAIGLILYDNPGSSSLARLGRLPWPEEINTIWWGPKTSPIVALFLTRKEAEQCFNSPDPQEKDPRWIKNTKEILRLIGDDHPVFVISGSDSWPKRSSWRKILD